MNLQRRDRNGDMVPAHPPTWLTSAVEARADWPGLRQLHGVTDCPILRADGSIFQSYGHDPSTGMFHMPSARFPDVPERPTREECIGALAAIEDLLFDFLFERPCHRAAFLAGLLTPIARQAFRGPAPLFLIDANIRGAGKGLLCQVIAEIALGRPMAVSSYVHEKEELRKQITSFAIAGDRAVLLDNIDGPFGNGVLDAMLTTTHWRDRILGKSQQVQLPLHTVWYATGNNVEVVGDTARRVVHIRLDVLDENPEDREGFRYADLLAHVRERAPDSWPRVSPCCAATSTPGSPWRRCVRWGRTRGGRRWCAAAWCGWE